MKGAISCGLTAVAVLASAMGNVQASESSPGTASHGSGAQVAKAADSGGHGATGPAAHWGYSGAAGPGQWGDLSTAYELCKTGHQQSPIDIGHTQQAGLASFEADYHAIPLHVVNNGHTIQVNYAPGSILRLGHSEYQLLQFHFHSPSENTLNGKHFDMEIHFVHKDGDGHLGVLGVFVEAGDHNVALQEIWHHMPKQANSEAKQAEVAINGRDLMPRKQDYYRFAGSLTTPPCSEGVQWHVLKQPIQASRDQVDAFVDIVGRNNRPVQRLGHRLLIDSEYGAGGSH